MTAQTEAYFFMQNLETEPSDSQTFRKISGGAEAQEILWDSFA